MPRRLPLILLLIALPIWLGASYGVRYLLMEDAQWVGICANEALQWECQLRSGLGWMIHFGIISWSALAVSLVAFFLRGIAGWRLAVLALLLGIAALVLYSASLGVFAVVIAGLRLVRAPKQKA
ncbi:MULTISPECIES: hypothetical protein [Pseudomonas]|uniref:Uncharacterized protein n=1 Tax=Pseudomonas syringae TaxID=317 RepID=A0A085UW78_PSESX|nr:MULTISPECIES: hypothetical protein [Pseudomonas]EPJ87125.1 hypothetical protein CFII64_08990 [Pseudomonas sp. CFII64]KFE47441.1 hypothetical protein IV02_22750 [Pseudomonas syringae]